MGKSKIELLEDGVIDIQGKIEDLEDTIEDIKHANEKKIGDLAKEIVELRKEILEGKKKQEKLGKESQWDKSENKLTKFSTKKWQYHNRGYCKFKEECHSSTHLLFVKIS